MNKQYVYLLFVLFLSCTNAENATKDPPGYDLNSPEKFNMPDVLNEVSGICFYKGESDTLYAEQDEEGKVFYLHLSDKKASHTKFGKKGDYEDITIVNEQVIMLRSNGTLLSFPFNEMHHEEVIGSKEWSDLVPPGEYEGLCADQSNKLYVLCKQCNNDENSKAITVYILQLQPDGSITQSGTASIDIKAIQELVGKKKLKFQPSAIAKNPQTQEWYIVSSVNNMLVVANSDWSIKEVYPLLPATFRQPEGIAFDNKNNLYISNEGDDVSKGNVLKFVYKKE